MAGHIYIGEVLENEEIQEDCFLMKIRVASSFENPVPGQFVMIRIAGLHEPFLSRPISIYSFTRHEIYCTMELFYRVVGKGTQILAGLIEGSQLEINGPLGNGFDVSSVKKKVVFISGGIGIAPLSMLIETLRMRENFSSSEMVMYPGFQSISAVVGLERMNKLCRDVHVCTDDGTIGEKGFVTQIFKKDLEIFKPEETSMFACGPRGMIKALANVLNPSNFNCQVSLEERMACGTGACMGCVVAIKDEKGTLNYKRVCTDGPVFKLNDIIWDET
jgi:dihydroorotate dehydrogenase electron transfer subunit